MRRIGFRMGPFELVDTIGADVNLAVSQSVYEAFFDPRYGRTRCSARWSTPDGWDARAGAASTTTGPMEPAGAMVRRRAASGRPRVDHLGEEQIAARLLATIVNEAASAVADGVATPEAIDTAMRLGANYPSGPLEWGERIGLTRWCTRWTR